MSTFKKNDDEGILQKFRSSAIPNNQGQNTESFYQNLIGEQEDFKFKNTASTVSTKPSNSGFAKPRISTESLKFKNPPTQNDVNQQKSQALQSKAKQASTPAISSKYPVTIQNVSAQKLQNEASQTKMKEKIMKNLNMTSHTASSSSSVKKPSIKNSGPGISLGNPFEQQKWNDRSMQQLKSMIDQGTAHLKQVEETKKKERLNQRELEKKQAEEEQQRILQEQKNAALSAFFGRADTASKLKSQDNQASSNLEADFFKDIAKEIEANKVNQGANWVDKGKSEETAIVVPQLTFEEREKLAQLRQLRYHNRKAVDELIKPILNLELVEQFSGEKPEFDPVPLTFQSFEHYRDIWIPLFLYETYSQMISQRSDLSKEKELLEGQGFKLNPNTQKKRHFQGYIQKNGQDMHYIKLKLFESEHQSQQKDRFGKYTMNVLDSLKEFDLLFICEEPLPTDEAKKIMNIEYLLSIRHQKGKMLCIVEGRRKKDQLYVSLKIDAKLHEEYACLNIKELDFLKVHVYYFDSLITTIREFRTIKSAEFFPTANIIIDPTLVNSDQSSCVQVSGQQQHAMQRFIHAHKTHFNESQLQALDQVTKMKKEDFLLIQGPPGTGKTHTIQGIITMLLSSDIKHILICAPSNAAIDEIVLRIANYRLFGSLSEAQLKQKLLRIGSMDYEPLPQVKKYTLDAKVREEMDTVDQDAPETKAQLQLENQLACLKEKKQFTTTIRRIIRDDQQEKEKERLNRLSKLLFTSIEKLQEFYKLSNDQKIQKLNELEKYFDQKSEEVKNAASNAPALRAKPKNKRVEVEKQIIQRSQIICTTLSMSASEKMEYFDKGEIEYLIVDEACQCVELTNLIPFVHEPKKVILVGDQQQLPATVFSENGDRTNYSRSLFERFLECGVNKFMLSIQYRMHPLIREFPSNQFYEGRLQDAIQLHTRDQDLPFTLSEIGKLFQNLAFFDIKYSQEETRQTSKSNSDEAEFITSLFTDIIKHLEQSPEFPPHFRTNQDKHDFIVKEIKNKIGIITPYKSQVHTLKDHLYPKLRQMNFPLDTLEVNTVDAYQGREKDIIIISCVRGSSNSGAIGFLNDYRRMNVAITRAKHFIWIVGNSRTLSSNENWKELIAFAKFQDKKNAQIQKLCYIKFDSKQDWENNKLVQSSLRQDPENTGTNLSKKDQNSVKDNKRDPSPFNTKKLDQDKSPKNDGKHHGSSDHHHSRKEPQGQKHYDRVKSSKKEKRSHDRHQKRDRDHSKKRDQKYYDKHDKDRKLRCQSPEEGQCTDPSSPISGRGDAEKYRNSLQVSNGSTDVSKSVQESHQMEKPSNPVKNQIDSIFDMMLASCDQPAQKALFLQDTTKPSAMKESGQERRLQNADESDIFSRLHKKPRIQ